MGCTTVELVSTNLSQSYTSNNQNDTSTESLCSDVLRSWKRHQNSLEFAFLVLIYNSKSSSTRTAHSYKYLPVWENRRRSRPTVTSAWAALNQALGSTGDCIKAKYLHSQAQSLRCLNQLLQSCRDEKKAFFSPCRTVESNAMWHVETGTALFGMKKLISEEMSELLRLFRPKLFAEFSPAFQRLSAVREWRLDTEILPF